MKTAKTHTTRQLFIATRNGVPCSLTYTYLKSRVSFRGRVLFPLPLPPCDPHVFRSSSTALAAVERTNRVSRRLIESIHSKWIATNYPTIKSLCAPADYAVEIYKGRSA